MSYRCGPTAIGSRASWGPLSSPTVSDKPFERGGSYDRPDRPLSTNFDRPLSGNFDRIFNAFERTNAFEYVNKDERFVGHGDIVVNRKMSSSFERADCALAAQTPCSEDEEFYREKILYSQARQLFPLQEDLADWINKTIGITYLTGENFLDVLDNGVELCQLAAVIHDRAREAIDSGLVVGPVPQIRGRCWQRAARRSFFSRDNTENFITFCRDLGVHENLLFESDDLVLHNQPRQVILCLLEVARLASKFGVEPPGLVQLEKEIAMEERDSGLDSAMSGAAWQFRDATPPPDTAIEQPPTNPDPNETQISVVDEGDAESTKSEGTVASTDSDVPLRPTNELDKRVQLVTRLMERGCRCGAGRGEGGEGGEGGRCNKLLKVKKVGEGRYNIAGRNVFIRLLKGRHMMVRVGGGWDTLEHFLSRHEPCQVRLVTAGRRGDVLPVPVPVPLPPPTAHPQPDIHNKTNRSRHTSLSSQSSLKDASLGTVSPVDSKLFSGKVSPVVGGEVSPLGGDLNGKTSPLGGKVTPTGDKSPDRARSRSTVSSGKSSPSDLRRTSTPNKTTPKLTTKSRSGLTLPLNTVDGPKTRARKQSAPSSFSSPGTPNHNGRVVRTPTEMRKSLTSTPLTNAPKKSIISISMLPDLNSNKKHFCGTDRLNQARKKSLSAATTPTEPNRNTRSHSLASTPVNDTKKSFATNGYAKKTRSMSLANPAEFRPLSNKSMSINGAMTQAAIEESIRLSLAATIADDSTKKPFLHIKAKYRSPPPREVPPR